MMNLHNRFMMMMMLMMMVHPSRSFISGSFSQSHFQMIRIAKCVSAEANDLKSFPDSMFGVTLLLLNSAKFNHHLEILLQSEC